MRIVLAIVGVVGLAVAGLAVASMRSDIQIILAAVGFFAAFICFGLSYLIRDVESLRRGVQRIEDEIPD